ncbi:probable helicase with zinc finger domain [Topomyia yanbarensis]|uniref:probable helicase with zinc finger domain n=1 Tax=Topomyia yanbarensis TaxID=2498891 RepID=UPI00273CE501|nr:probable helicase with zinc finger domain [Topomyia yanbarensis]XP_058833824.1 probable helicase with zinc finger domain [Topomyia yanbarensis]XP_058833825.1 probable helicase with zinc finger domain [Topomyia yanbarensis]XP_058833826.1 probable helicase with zinc finger domain [Topomyia yanbarensis]
MTESQASEHLRNRQWQKAKDIYDELLSTSQNNCKLSKERTISCLYGRTESCLELEKYDIVAEDCRHLLNLLNDNETGASRAVGSTSPVPSSASSSSSTSSSSSSQNNPTATTESKVRKRLIHSLYKQQKYSEAEIILQEWANNHNHHQDINRYLDRLKSVLRMASANSSPTPAPCGSDQISTLGGVPKVGDTVSCLPSSDSSGGPSSTPTSTISSLSSLNDEYEQIEIKLENLIINNLPPDRYTKQLNQIENNMRATHGNQENSQEAHMTINDQATNSREHKSNEKEQGINISVTNTDNENGETSNSTLDTSGSSSVIGNRIVTSNDSVAVRTTISTLAAEAEDELTSASNTDSSHINNFQKQLDKIANISCVYCTMTFVDRSELRAHCQTESHQNIIMSDEGRDWKWRPPPRGFTAESYSLCENYLDNQTCHYGNQCVEAHGIDELNEWKERFEYRKKKLQRARDKELYGKSYTEQLLERWVQAPSPDKVMKEKIEGVEESCSQDLVTTVSSKVSKREWTFVLKTRRLLRAVALLQDAHRNHFLIKQIFPGEPRSGSVCKKLGQTITVNKVVEAELTSDQEWVATSDYSKLGDLASETNPLLEHRVKVIFNTDIYGTFRQAVVFDLGHEPVLVKHLCVDVVPVTEVDKIQEIRKDIVMSTSERWDETNSEIIEFTTTIIPHMQTPAYAADAEREKDLLLRYPLPKASSFVLTQSTITEKKLTKNNYRNRIHELLYVEEIARYEQIARYNLTTRLTIATNYLLTPSGMATSTAKYSHSGELFALMKLGKDVSEDTSAGRLILNNCQAVLIASKEPVPPGEKRKVYEAVIEDKGKNMIYLKTSAKAVAGLGLKAETEFISDIQFQPNRLTYCEWHHAIDKIADFRIIFPDIYLEPSIPWTPQRQWDASLDPKLNSKQREAVVAITTPIDVALPPILLIGPFGTGKTYTLAQAIKQLLLQPESKILICTHSNSAADLYIKDYLHPWVEEGMEEAKPLRVYYHKRWVATVNSIVQKYCLIDLNINVRNFRRPTVEDILKYRIVVVTLNISMELASLELPKGHFTHIFLDEAAQAMECEAIMPLALATEKTRIVLAGDHMQMSPELFSNFAKERKLHISLLERLYDHYPNDFPCKILLCENYRAHEAIIKFTSELFYEQKLIASGKQPRHEKFYPLTFFTTRGEDVQDKNSTAFYNNSEVYEVVERVCELRKKWPSSWGKINDQSIGIMTPYADQVFRIRSELRKRRMGGISVERVLNVQGKQFRAIFLSTVRTRRTCTTNTSEISTTSEDVDYGFLSNSKLLNTAITRAQSLVAVVGDPVALCSIGRCRKVWERFIEICYQNKSLFGITWSLLRSQLDGVELKKTYVLNPLAPEFIPRALQAEAYLREQAANVTGQFHQQPPHHIQHTNNYHHPVSQNFSGGHSVTSGGMIRQIAPQMQQPQPPFINHGPGSHTGHPPLPQQTQQQFPYQNHMFFYQQQQQQQQQPQPMRGPPPHPPSTLGPPVPPNIPQAGPTAFQQNNPANLWNAPGTAGHFPMVPSPGGRNTPPGWRLPQKNSVQPVRPQITQHQHMPITASGRPLIPPPMRSPVSQQQQLSAVPQMPYLQQQQQNKALQNYSPFPHHQQHPPAIGHHHQQQQQTHQMHQNHIRPILGGPISPSSYQQQQQQQQQTSLYSQQDPYLSNLSNDLMASITARASQMQLPPTLPQQALLHQQTPKLNSLRIDDRHTLDKDIQFLQNVHIPDKFSQPTTIQQQQHQHHSNTAINADLNHLLPPNMSFLDVALQSKEFQYLWFIKLVETQGLEAANKFTDILRQVPLAPNTAQHQQPQKKLNPTMPSQADMILENIINPNKDVLGSTSLHHSTMLHPQQNVPSVLTNGNALLGPNNGKSLLEGVDLFGNMSSSLPNELPLISTNPPSTTQQSVPLYRRQAGQNYQNNSGGTSTAQSIASSTPDLLDNHLQQSLFESLDGKLHANNSSSMLFGGGQNQNQFAAGEQANGFQGFASIHNIAAGLMQQQHNLNNREFLHQLQQQQAQHHHHQQQQQHHLHDSRNVSAASTVEELLSRQNQTYASVLSQGGGLGQTNKQLGAPKDGVGGGVDGGTGSPGVGDPFAALRDLGRKSNGFYNYFQ